MKLSRITAVSVAALLLSILFRSLAFVFAKYAALATADSGIAYIVINPWYWAELAALGGQTVFWIIVLRHMPLSTAYPSIALVYGVNLAWAWYLFGETVTAAHLAGCAIIMFGILLTVPPDRGKEA